MHGRSSVSLVSVLQAWRRELIRSQIDRLSTGPTSAARRSCDCAAGAPPKLTDDASHAARSDDGKAFLRETILFSARFRCRGIRRTPLGLDELQKRYRPISIGDEVHGRLAMWILDDFDPSVKCPPGLRFVVGDRLSLAAAGDGDPVRPNAEMCKGLRDDGGAPVRKLEIEVRGTACVGMTDNDEFRLSPMVENAGEPADIGLGTPAEPDLAGVEQPAGQRGAQAFSECALFAGNRNGEWCSLSRDLGERGGGSPEFLAAAVLPDFVLGRKLDYALRRCA